MRAFVVGGGCSLPSSERRCRRLANQRRHRRHGASNRIADAWPQAATRAAEAVGATYAGVDLIQSRDGELFVLEVNAIPGWHGLQRATRVDVAGAVVDHLLERVAARRGFASVAGPP